MLQTIREQATVQPGGLLELRHPELPVGSKVEVIITLESSDLPSITSLIGKEQSQPRPIGLANDSGVPLPEDFFAPLPDKLLAAFNGER